MKKRQDPGLTVPGMVTVHIMSSSVIGHKDRHRFFVSWRFTTTFQYGASPTTCQVVLQNDPFHGRRVRRPEQWHDHHQCVIVYQPPPPAPPDFW